MSCASFSPSASSGSSLIADNKNRNTSQFVEAARTDVKSVREPAGGMDETSGDRRVGING